MLNSDMFNLVVKNTPLVSIDLSVISTISYISKRLVKDFLVLPIWAKKKIPLINDILI